MKQNEICMHSGGDRDRDQFEEADDQHLDDEIIWARNICRMDIIGDGSIHFDI